MTTDDRNLRRHDGTVHRADREALLRQRGGVVWFTGLSGSGKSTVARSVEARLAATGRLVYVLDGDNVRHGLCKDLGFSAADRTENIRRLAHVAALFVDAGVLVLTAFISPFRADRQVARTLLGADFLEVFVDAPLAVCEQRDPKGLYRKARALPGIKRIFIASGLRYDLAIHSPEYVRELARHHVGGYLKIAPEHVAEGPLSKMMKPGVGTYYAFKKLFDRYSKEAGKEQFLIPYFIAAHPGTTDEDMLELALWLKKNGYKVDQVQTFLPSPMASATAMYHTERDVLEPLHRDDATRVPVVRNLRIRRLHKAFLRFHDPENWPMLREALLRMGRRDLIGPGEQHLVPWHDRAPAREPRHASRGPRKGTALTQHTGLPPRAHSEADARRANGRPAGKSRPAKGRSR